MDSLNHDNQADVIEAFNSTSRFLCRKQFQIFFIGIPFRNGFMFQKLSIR